MSELIRREDVVEALYQAIRITLTGTFTDSMSLAIAMANNLPSAEPERKIIYCKDCRFAHLTTEGEIKYCDVWFPETKTYLSADDFCSSAEKRGE